RTIAATPIEAIHVMEVDCRPSWFERSRTETGHDLIGCDLNVMIGFVRHGRQSSYMKNAIGLEKMAVLRLPSRSRDVRLIRWHRI
ncbi:MAG: hypothetical protein J0H30_07420, partial [Alphaproteobacteria bacterium]|nr:hypothetical protein [Alphaproteobacteria bacterium]